ncbi:MAG: NAD(P)-dependent oxidoreductase [bacterium]
MEFDNLITSPFGLGEKLILELLRKGESVFAVFPTAKDVPMSFLGKKNLKYGFLKFEQDPILQKTLPRRVKHVFHIFEQYRGNFSRIFKANTLATLLLLEWAKNAGIESMIYLSSGEVYGKGEILDEKSQCDPHGFYATTKYQSEMLLGFYQRFFRISIVRIFFPFGKCMEQGYIYELANAIKCGDKFNGKYDNIAPTFVDDVVVPLLRIRELKDSNIFNICGSAVKTDGLVEEVAHVVQKSHKKIETGKYSLVGNNARAKEKLGYTETALNKAINISFETLE